MHYTPNMVLLDGVDRVVIGEGCSDLETLNGKSGL